MKKLGQGWCQTGDVKCGVCPLAERCAKHIR
jgi:endonuclease III